LLINWLSKTHPLVPSREGKLALYTLPP